ncbi:MAG: hypothetical protein H6Q79_2518, partial [Deltaproteobacteria bacterium]|nr:hypothetical protein [Deltaproteobacteria bacterium]
MLLFRILLLALLLSPAGCHRGVPVGTPPAAPPPGDVAADNAAPAAATEWIPTAVPVVERGHDNDAIPDTPRPVGPAAAELEASGTVPGPPDRIGAPSPAKKPPSISKETASARKPALEVAPPPITASPPKETIGAAPPAWARGREELAYRVDFIGITMGYARFRYEGKVSIAGKTAYHLNVRAWTSGALSYIYPIN